MTEEVQGIEGLKKAVKSTLNLFIEIQGASADGWQWTDAFKFIDDVSAVAGIVQGAKQLGAEIKDLSEPERSELYTYIQTEFDIPDDHVEAIVEKALATAISIWTLIDEIRKSNATKSKGK